MSPKKMKPLFYKGMRAARGDESNINVMNGRALAAKFTPEGEGFADQVLDH